ncbi:hypothetical protein OG216_19440 [Streptomycetaceae bacterium NBC_01309]
MRTTRDQVQFIPYGPDRFPRHASLFSDRGYLFTVPGDYPEDTPAHTNVTSQEMAVYRIGRDWEVRDVNGLRKVWGTGTTRREAVGLALAEIARRRRRRAADIAEKRVKDCGLEVVPPFAVEVTEAVTLVLAPEVIAHLIRIEPAEGERPALYHVCNPVTVATYTIEAGDNVALRPLTTGVLHVRCGCDPAEAARFEHESYALAYIRETLSVWTLCPRTPGAPDPGDEQPDDAEVPVRDEGGRDTTAEHEAQVRADAITDAFERAYQDAQQAREAIMKAGFDMLARVVRRHFPDSTGISVRHEDRVVTAVHRGSETVWVESDGEPHHSFHLDTGAYLTDVLTFFGCVEVLYDDWAWEEVEHSPGVLTVALPSVS